MNIYLVSTGSYSSKAHQIVEHHQKFSKEEFAAVCKLATDTVVKKDDYSDNLENVVKELTENHGFSLPHIMICHFWDYGYEYDQKNNLDDLFQVEESNEAFS